MEAYITNHLVLCLGWYKLTSHVLWMLSEPNWPCRIWYDFIPPLSSEGVTPLVFSPSALFGTLGELSIDTHFVVLEFPYVAIVGDYPEVISTPKYIPVLSSNASSPASALCMFDCCKNRCTDGVTRVMSHGYFFNLHISHFTAPPKWPSRHLFSHIAHRHLTLTTQITC